MKNQLLNYASNIQKSLQDQFRTIEKIILLYTFLRHTEIGEISNLEVAKNNELSLAVQAEHENKENV